MLQYHGRDLRKGRFSVPGCVYLLTTVTHNRQAVLEPWQAGRLLVKELRRSDEDGFTRTLAYVVMPDHLHWLVEHRTGRLADIVRRIKSRRAIAIHRLSGETGQVWQRGYHDHALRREQDLRVAARYLVANPLRAGLVSKIGDYPLWDAVWL